jgi:hypothetical protein
LPNIFYRYVPHLTGKSVYRLGYWLDSERLEVHFPARARDFSLFHGVQISSEADPDLYVMGIWAVSLLVRWLKQECDHLPPSNDEVKNGGAIPSLPHTSS